MRSTLHVAPETQTARFLRALSTDYLSIDLRPGRAMRQEDLTSLTLPDSSFSLVFCSHVLEHIADDGAAISEMRRVLEPTGVLVVLVPLRGEVTEEEVLDDPEERFRRYGLSDHVRMYGLDIVERLERRFTVELQVSTNIAEPERTRLGLQGTEEHAFVCTAR